MILRKRSSSKTLNQQQQPLDGNNNQQLQQQQQQQQQQRNRTDSAEREVVEASVKESLKLLEKLSQDTDIIQQLISSQQADLQQIRSLTRYFHQKTSSESYSPENDLLSSSLNSGVSSTAIPSPSFSKELKIVYGSGKIFKPRDSRLSELLLVKEFQTIYHIFVAVLIILGINLTLQNYYSREMFIDFSLLRHVFGKLDIVLYIWICMFVWSVCGYVFTWSGQLFSLSVNLAIYLSFQSVLALFACLMTLKCGLPPASGFIVMCEQTRLSMKVHSYFRSFWNGPPSSRLKLAYPGDEKPPSTIFLQKDSSLSQYLYFIFCPSLLYRPHYPRTAFVKWSKVLTHFLECAFTFLYLFVMFEHYLFPVVELSATDDLSSLLVAIFNAMLPSVLILVFGFFGFLHCWLNMWSELLQFADREFYKDWWNSHNFAEYYRKWNGVVYDWLWAYCYNDLVALLESRKGMSKTLTKGLAAFLVIQISAFIHEYIIALAFGNFFPLLWFVYGGPGVLFNYLNSSNRKSRDTNVFIWLMLIAGCGILIALYSKELQYRKKYVNRKLQMSELNYWVEFFTSYSFDHYLGHYFYTKKVKTQ